VCAHTLSTGQASGQRVKWSTQVGMYLAVFEAGKGPTRSSVNVAETVVRAVRTIVLCRLPSPFVRNTPSMNEKPRPVVSYVEVDGTVHRVAEVRAPRSTLSYRRLCLEAPVVGLVHRPH